ncbi:hypothetical protein EDB80DRAFT_821259 [Ilyonectria destructans]|nr:hypothetical protein EDB80DRAFT_821259 [Ilyonectria destructans]
MATKYDRFYRTTFSGAEERKFLPPYLQGCPETLVEKECQIEGELPTYVRGTLLRGGCGQYILETSDDGLTKPVVLQHWFDGLMMLHKFRTEDGKAYYMSKHTANGIINRVRKQGFYDSPTVGISPNQALSPIDPCLVRLGAQIELSFLLIADPSCI